MARKSRRNKNVEAVSNQIIENCENLIDTGAYIRLSVENGGNETDETLVIQQMLVEKFIEEHPDLKLAGTYMDCILGYLLQMEIWEKTIRTKVTVLITRERFL